MTAAENLTGYNRIQYENEVLRTNQGLLRLAQSYNEQEEITIQMPDKVNKPGWARGFKSHDKTTKRLMTGAEAATKDADKAEKAQRRQQPVQQVQPTTEQGELIWLDPLTPLVNAPPVSSTSVSAQNPRYLSDLWRSQLR